MQKNLHLFIYFSLHLKAGCSVFNAGCNEQVFSRKAWKKFTKFRFVVFEKNAKMTHFNSEKKKNFTEPKAGVF